MARKTNYLNNRDLLKEIHKSKISYCEFIDEQYSEYDAIVTSLDEINSNFIKDTLEKKAELLTKQKKLENKEAGIKGQITPILPSELSVDDLVFRLMTMEHIPIDPAKVEKAKTPEAKHIKCNFPPFKHYVLSNYTINRLGNYKNLEFKEVGRSHWEGGFENGQFNLDKGKLTNKLALMIMKLVERNGMRGNWRGYTYNDEMQGQALVQLSKVALQFNEYKSSNPFSYYTEAINHSFTRVLNDEKKIQKIRDDVLIASGSNPSYTRQVEHDIEQKKTNNDAEETKVKKGRRPKQKHEVE